MDAVINYPDPEAKRLRKAVSSWTRVPEEMIIAGNGAIEIIYLLMKLLSPHEALIPAPTFNEYEIAVRISGGTVRDLPLSEEKGFSLEKAKLFDLWDNADCIFICNPNNPTGTLTTRSELQEIIEKAGKSGKTVIVDEAFMDFVKDKHKYSVMDLVPRYENLFVLYSLTKFFAIPGLRLGIGLGSPDIINKLNEIRDPWNVNCFAQLAGIDSLEDEQYINSTVQYISGEKDYLYSSIKSIQGFDPIYPSVNYIFTNIEGTGYSSQELCEILGSKGILVRDCSTYKNLRPVFIRTAVKTREDNDRLIEALQQLGRK